MAPYEELLFIASVLSFGGFLLWLAVRFAAERARERDRRNQVIEAQIARFAEAREFVEFARSDAGLAWIRAGDGARRVRVGLLALMLAGILFTALGGGLLANALRLAGSASPHDALAQAHAAWWGTLFTALGLGTLAASAFAARLGRKWGLLPPS